MVLEIEPTNKMNDTARTGDVTTALFTLECIVDETSLEVGTEFIWIWFSNNI